ncbi:MAG TPA: tyrosine-type recombinase/integrase, partial [Mycobacteriales bacterium]
GLVFQAEKGGPMLRTTLNGRWRRTLRRAGVPGSTHLHHLRHLYATVLIGAGVPFTTVAELLGHTPQGVTWAVYTHRPEGWDRQVRTVLDDAWSAILADSVRTSEAQPASDLGR